MNPSRFFLILKIILALCASASGFAVLGEPETAPGELVTAALEKAQILFLQNARKEAVDELGKLIKLEALSDPERDKIKSTWRKIAFRFYSESARKKFELAESVYYSGSNEAFMAYSQSLELEPENASIHLALSRLYLRTGACGKAQKSLDKVRELIFFHEALEVLGPLVSRCNQTDPGDLSAVLSKEAIGVDTQILVALALEQMSVEKKDLQENSQLQHISQRASSNEFFPGVYYQLMKAVQNEAEEYRRWAERYVEACGKLDSKTRRHYKNAPGICTELEEVKEGLRALNQEASP